MSHRFSFYSKQQSQALLERLKKRRSPNFAYLVIDCERELDEWVTKIETESCFIALDTETKGLTPAPGMVKTIQIAHSADEPVSIVELPKIKDKSSLQRLMGSPKLLKVGHHIKFDILMLKAEGIEVRGPVMCTMLGIEVLKAGATRQASLQFTAQDLLNIELDKTEQNSDWSGKLSKTQLQYAANDAGILIEILTELQQKLDEAGLNNIAILEYCCLLPITEMQSRGIYLDRDRWRQVRKEYEQQRDRLAERIYRELNREFNIVSSSQLLKALQTYGIEIKSTNSNVLIEQVKKHPVIAEIIKYRSLNTIINTFLKGFEPYIQSDNRLRGNWWQIGTRTGRTSCQEPNLSNIPKIPKIRNCFAASDGYMLVDADYSQIELRLAAKRMNVPTLIEAFKQGQDIHSLTASYIYNCDLEELTPQQRKLGKILNLGLIYGMGAEKFRLNAAKKFGVYLTAARSKELREMFFAFYSEIEQYHALCRRSWQQGQQQASSTLGRINIWSSKSPKLNQIINYPIQADCADILKQAISSWYLKCLHQKLDAYLVLTAYDQLVIEAREEQANYAAQILKKVMIEAGQDLLDPVPVVVDIKIGKYWS
ncbi:MAG: DNA polymerase [Pleurocapsa sp. MO_226.B13]|nr:DNA polymerase [Pleurocapsa sp. MO_226.B13]